MPESRPGPTDDAPLSRRSLRAVGMRNLQLRHSEWLRDGLATTLLLIAVLHEEAGLRMTGGTTQDFVDGIVDRLAGLRQDHRLIASLRDELPLLMEAAPRPLLLAL